MKKSTNAMSDISEIYIDELKNISTPIVKRHSFRMILIAATLAVILVCASLFAFIGSNPPEIPNTNVFACVCSHLRASALVCIENTSMQ